MVARIGSRDERLTFYAAKHHVLDTRARAAIVHCHIVDRAMELFREVPGVVPGRKQGVFRLFVGAGIALRFKKAKKDGTTSNISTRQQRLIDLQMTIPGVLLNTMLSAVLPTRRPAARYQAHDGHSPIGR